MKKKNWKKVKNYSNLFLLSIISAVFFESYLNPTKKQNFSQNWNKCFSQELQKNSTKKNNNNKITQTLTIDFEILVKTIDSNRIVWVKNGLKVL
jgi:hypothetical protein